jgi:hypothetical protein
MAFRHFTTFHTDFDREACVRRLDDSIDPWHRTPLSFSGFEGSKPVLGWINGYEFRLRKRRYYNNGFAPEFYGNLKANGRGTIVEGYFDMARVTKWGVRIWLGGAILMGIPIFVSTLRDLIRGSSYAPEGFLIGLLVPPTMVLLGILLPKFGLWLGRNEEKYILEFLQTTLIASPSQMTHRTPAQGASP